MYNSTVFIVSKRKELSVKHKKALEASNNTVFIINSLPKMFEEIKEKEPDLIMISDTIYEDFVEIIKQIKVLTYNYSPVIIAISRSSNLEDRLTMLQNGADDCFGEEITNKELTTRISAYMRRYVENSLNPTTGIIGEKLGIKNLKRKIETKANSSIVLTEIQNSAEYKEIYGEIAYGKVMQTIGALINSALSEKDFITHLLSDRFILITDPTKAERLASFLTFAFDNMLDKFYSEADFKNKFIKYFSDDTLENKIPLMKLNIGIINLENDNSANEKILITHLNSLIKVCRKNKNSTYIIDRIKISGSCEKIKEKNRIMIVEKDEALSYLIQTACELQGLISATVRNLSDFDRIFNMFEPDLVILDDEEDKIENSSIEICKKIKNISEKTKIIFTSSKRKKTQILASGADLYLPKPYEISTLVEWSKKFLKED